MKFKNSLMIAAMALLGATAASPTFAADAYQKGDSWNSKNDSDEFIAYSETSFRFVVDIDTTWTHQERDWLLGTKKKKPYGIFIEGDSRQIDATATLLMRDGWKVGTSVSWVEHDYIGGKFYGDKLVGREFYDEDLQHVIVFAEKSANFNGVFTSVSIAGRFNTGDGVASEIFSDTATNACLKAGVRIPGSIFGLDAKGCWKHAFDDVGLFEKEDSFNGEGAISASLTPGLHARLFAAMGEDFNRSYLIDGDERQAVGFNLLADSGSMTYKAGAEQRFDEHHEDDWSATIGASVRF